MSSTDTRNLGITAVLQDDAAGAQLTFNAASQQAGLTVASAGPSVFERSSITLNLDDRLVYDTPAGFLSLSRPGPAVGGFASPLRYVIQVVQTGCPRNAAFNLDCRDRRYVTGSATLAADVPTSGNVAFTTLLASTRVNSTSTNAFIKSMGELRIDFASRVVAGTIVAESTSSSEPVSTISLAFSGQLNASTGRINGSVTSPEGFAGVFSGRLYGPAGVEVGAGFALERGAERLVGTVVGVKR